METYSCIEKINQPNLRRIIRAGKYKNYKDQGDTIHKQLISIQKYTRKTGSHEVHYAVKEKLMKTQAIGRLYPKRASVQGLPRNVRKALCYDNYSDVDLVNAHPTILNQILQKEGLYSDLLNHYVNNREEVFDTMNLPRDEAKEEISSVINGKQPVTEYSRNLHVELMDCYDELFERPAYANYLTYGKLKNPRNPMGTAISAMMTDYERKAVTVAINLMRQRGLGTGALLHDGFLVDALEVDDTILEDAKVEIRRCVGLDLNLKIKPMNDFDTSVLWGCEDLNAEDSGELGDRDAAERFYTHITAEGHKLLRCGGFTWWYNAEEGIWFNDLTTLRRYIWDCPNLGEYNQMTRKQDAMLVQFKSMIQEDTDFMKRSTMGLLPFNNGVWDFNAKMLKPFSSDYFFTHKLPWDYGEVDTTLMAEIREKLVEGVFGKLGSYYLKVLARAIAGNVDDKVFNVCIGDSNSGKGCNTDALFGAFPGFVSNINASNFAFKRSDGDGAKNRSWMVGCSRARLLVCNEISMKDPLDGNIIKTISSGGDPITARQNYKDEVEFVMSGTSFVFANDMPTINPVDDAIQNRMRYIETAYSYLDGHMYESKKSLEHVRLADPELKTVFLKRRDVLRTFALMVVGEWKPEKPVPPEEVIKATKEWTQADDVVEKLNGLFEVSDKPDDFVSSALLKNAVIRLNLDISDTKLGRTMTKLGYKSVVKKIKGKPVRVFMGVKLAGEVGDFVDF